MKTIKNFQIYSPDENELEKLAFHFFKTDELPHDWKDWLNSQDIQFLRSEDGRDWYLVQSEFASDTVKIIHDERGIICAASLDVSSLPGPVNQSVTEISFDALPEGFAPDCKWRLSDSLIIPVEVDNAGLAEQQKAARLIEAAAAIAPLQDAVELGIATDDEAAQLITWKKYRVLLNRVDISSPADIVWPVAPAA
jgi:hypothetical protein